MVVVVMGLTPSSCLALPVIRFRRGRRRRLGALEAQVLLDPFGHAAGALLSRAGGGWGASSATQAAAARLRSVDPVGLR